MSLSGEIIDTDTTRVHEEAAKNAGILAIEYVTKPLAPDTKSLQQLRIEARIFEGFFSADSYTGN